MDGRSPLTDATAIYQRVDDDVLICHGAHDAREYSVPVHHRSLMESRELTQSKHGVLFI